MADEFLIVSWDRLNELPAVERAKRAAALQDETNDVKKRLAEISATAIREMIEGGRPRDEIATLLGISVQRVGQLIGSGLRPDGVDLAQLRFLAQTMLDRMTLSTSTRRQVQQARRSLSKPGRLSTFEARGTAARLAYVCRNLTEQNLEEVPVNIRTDFQAAAAHAEAAYRA